MWIFYLIIVFLCLFILEKNLYILLSKSIDMLHFLPRNDDDSQWASMLSTVLYILLRPQFCAQLTCFSFGFCVRCANVLLTCGILTICNSSCKIGYFLALTASFSLWKPHTINLQIMKHLHNSRQVGRKILLLAFICKIVTTENIWLENFIQVWLS